MTVILVKAQILDSRQLNKAHRQGKGSRRQDRQPDSRELYAYPKRSER